MSPVKKVKEAIINIKQYWKVPAKGRYMPYKEIMSLATGGIGVRFIVTVITQMTISVGNTLIGNTIGIDPSSLYVIYILSLLSGFPLTAIRAKMIDNTRSMKGKYRPYIITMGIPTVILGIGFICMPYENMSLFVKCAVVLAYNVAFQFFYNFFLDSYDSLINVLSPNSIERSDALSVRSVVENLSPSIYNIAFPLLAKLITGQNTLYDLMVFRLLYPGMLLAGMLISILVYVNTEEKIVQAKTHFVEVKFMDALRAVVRNKYFWIISLAGWIGFLEGSFNNIMQWMYNYQSACSAGQYSLIIAISGNASFWPNLVAPFLIRKYGKKKILIWSNIFNVGLIALMLPVVRQTGNTGIIWMLLGCIFVNQFITSLGHLLTPSINADIRDYQQYISGERIDGMFAAVGLIGNVITMITGLVLPKIYDASGLNEETAIKLGFDGSNVYDVLFDKGYFISICTVLIIASIVGAALNVIPYFFFDFTEAKQKATVAVLKIRAAFEDLGNNALTNETLSEVKEIITTARENEGKEITANLNNLPKADKKSIKEENEKIEIAKFVMGELRRFDCEEGKEELRIANSIKEAGINGFLNVKIPDRKYCKNMPNVTEEDKRRKRDALQRLQYFNDSKKAVSKYFPNGIKEFDMSLFEELFNKEDKLDNDLTEYSKQMKQAKESGRTDLIADLRVKIAETKKNKTLIQKDIKRATKDNSVYHRAAKPYLDAVNLVKQSENFARIEELLN